MGGESGVSAFKWSCVGKIVGGGGGVRIRLRWGCSTLLKLSMPISHITSQRTKEYLSISSKGSVVEGTNFIDRMRFQRIETILNMKIPLDSLPLCV